MVFSTREQYRTVNELFERSHANSVYFTLLILSVFIITSGLLLNNAFIVLGGMLITPVLTPILIIALGISVGELGAIKNALWLMFESFLFIIAGAIILTFFLGAPADTPVFENTMRTAVLYFIVALSSGIVATFAWVRKEVHEMLTGIAIAIALVPPLSLMSIRLMMLDFSATQFYFLVFFFNLLGILVGSLVVFSLLKFHRSEEKVHKEAKEAQKEEKEKKSE